MKRGFEYVNRHVNLVLEAYANPGEFKSPHEYLSAISEVLEDLCKIKGVEPMPLPKEWVAS